MTNAVVEIEQRHRRALLKEWGYHLMRISLVTGFYDYVMMSSMQTT